ncbi:hypothetical protein CALVIDRAFT_557566 [Calocera viscosa TUFC12733]|uniref:Uncharacterized protein n=1 Tax=Calocera viscosa (strain TUFC12733) TaxID=1330018 RepID=A0A167IC13_CALVF|nr:hypothetical protein CALVIDRAFT_557566 [Calocera viscosa TUFC12733]
MKLALAIFAISAAALVHGLFIGRFFDASGTSAAVNSRAGLNAALHDLWGYVAVVSSDDGLVCYMTGPGYCTIGGTNQEDAVTFTAMPIYLGLQAVYSVNLLPGWNLAIQKVSAPRGYFNGSAGSVDSGEISILSANETPGTYNTNGVSEGGIWTIALLGGQLTATWTNEDGTQVGLGFLQDPYYGFVYAAPDPAAFNEWQYSDGGADDGYLYNDVSLFFVPEL